LPGTPLTPGGEPTKLRMSEAIEDMCAYTALNDSILDRIQFSS
jgi:hypothetical protein